MILLYKVLTYAAWGKLGYWICIARRWGRGDDGQGWSPISRRLLLLLLRRRGRHRGYTWWLATRVMRVVRVVWVVRVIVLGRVKGLLRALPAATDARTQGDAVAAVVAATRALQHQKNTERLLFIFHTIIRRWGEREREEEREWERNRERGGESECEIESGWTMLDSRRGEILFPGKERKEEELYDWREGWRNVRHSF